MGHEPSFPSSVIVKEFRRTERRRKGMLWERIRGSSLGLKGTQEDTLEHRGERDQRKAPRGEKKNKTHYSEKKEKDKPDMRQLRVPNNGGAPSHFGGKVIWAYNSPAGLTAIQLGGKTLFWVVPSVRRVYFQQIPSKIITSSDTLAKRKMNPRGRHGLQEPVKLFLSGDEAWKILSAVWEENPNDLILGSGRERMGWNKTEKWCILFMGTDTGGES